LAAYPHWWKIKVRSLSQAELAQAAAELAMMAHGFNPTLVLGIRTGGYIVAGLMAKHLPQATLLAVTCQRPGTKKKQVIPFAGKILRALPHSVTDRLRILEHIVLTQLRTPTQGVLLPEPGELAAIEHYLLTQSGSTRILIVDDAVDSGATLSAVYKAVQGIAGSGAVIKIAALTVTTASPLLEPDFSLYRYVLCRFPWSLDAKE